MMRLLSGCFFLFLLCVHSIVISQQCLPKGITFTTQNQIDSFQINDQKIKWRAGLHHFAILLFVCSEDES